MNENEVEEQHAEPQEALVLGKKIRIAREAKNLSQVDLADKLKLHVTTVEFLEAEQFAQLPAPAFVRGYIRAIAIALDLDVDEALHIYAAHKQSDPNLSSTSTTERQRKATDPAMVWGTAALLVLVVVLLVVWGVNSLGGESSELQELGVAETEAESFSDIQLSLNNMQTAVAANTELAEESSALTLAPEAELEVPSGVTPASINHKAPKGSDRLTVTAKGPSWADISDATGFQLVYGLLDKNDQQQRLTGTAPFNVFLGDAGQVELEFQGNTFNFSEHVRANNVAKFSVK